MIPIDCAIVQEAHTSDVKRFEAVTAILTDIEGTTTSISFVHDVLFPYAKENVGPFLVAHQNEPQVAQIIADVKTAAETPDADLEQVIATLVTWMNQDKKITSLKALQGLMWEDGYEQEAFQGHVYDDAFEQMIRWNEQGFPLYIYSSGSIHAQKLLFAHTSFGDMTALFAGHFDTTTGMKKDPMSYVLIAQKIGLPPHEVLFLSDSVDELNAAQAAGMQTLLLAREGVPCPCVGHPFVTTFEQITIE